MNFIKRILFYLMREENLRVTQQIKQIDRDLKEVQQNFHQAVDEKHQMIILDRARIKEQKQWTARLFTEKHEMVMHAQTRIDNLEQEMHRRVDEVEQRLYQRVEELEHWTGGLFTEKHEMILEDRKTVHLLAVQEILRYYREADPSEDIANRMQYLSKHPFCMYPYEWVEEYSQLPVEVFESDGWHFVMHKGKQMYFPQKYSMQQVQEYYRWLLIEQDERSPHRYTSSAQLENPSLVMVDVGTAEGFWGLEHVDTLQKLYLVECDPDWTEALKKSFAPYEDKVKLLEKRGGAWSGISTIALRDITDADIIKVDVEGAEQSVLDGLKGTTLKKGCEILIAAYHHQHDEAFIVAFMEKNKMEIQKNKGYILSTWGGYEPPYLRAGVIKGRVTCEEPIY